MGDGKRESGKEGKQKGRRIKQVGGLAICGGFIPPPAVSGPQAMLSGALAEAHKAAAKPTCFLSSSQFFVEYCNGGAQCLSPIADVRDRLQHPSRKTATTLGERRYIILYTYSTVRLLGRDGDASSLYCSKKMVKT